MSVYCLTWWEKLLLSIDKYFFGVSFYPVADKLLFFSSQMLKRVNDYFLWNRDSDFREVGPSKG